jgi:hypothetical protein
MLLLPYTLPWYIIGGWVGPRAGTYIVAKKNPWLYWETLVIQPIA